MRLYAAQALIKSGNISEKLKKGLQSLIFDEYYGDEAAELLKKLKLRNDS